MATQTEVLITQSQAMTTQANWEVEPHGNQNGSSMASHLRDFTRINPQMFFRSKVNRDPQDFLDEVYKFLCAMGVSSNEKAQLAAYQLKDVAQTLGGHFLIGSSQGIRERKRWKSSSTFIKEV